MPTDVHLDGPPPHLLSNHSLSEPDQYLPFYSRLLGSTSWPLKLIQIGTFCLMMADRNSDLTKQQTWMFFLCFAFLLSLQSFFICFSLSQNLTEYTTIISSSLRSVFIYSFLEPLLSKYVNIFQPAPFIFISIFIYMIFPNIFLLPSIHVSFLVFPSIFLSFLPFFLFYPRFWKFISIFL